MHRDSTARYTLLGTEDETQMKDCCNLQVDPLAVLEQEQTQPHHSILPKSVSQDSNSCSCG